MLKLLTLGSSLAYFFIFGQGFVSGRNVSWRSSASKVYSHVDLI